MVYFGNIIKAHEELDKDEKVICKFGDGEEIGINPEDKLEKLNGDLKITRAGNPADKINVLIDTAFVKFIVISRRFL